jgi:hypothetical protein
MRPEAIGIIAASDSSAMIALSEMIERTFSMVGNVPGSRIENSRISRRSESPAHRRV